MSQAPAAPTSAADQARTRSRLTVRDLISLGVLTALYYVVLLVPSLIGAFAPILMFVGWAIGILLNGMVIALLITRTPKLGALTLLGLLTGVLMTLTGNTWLTIPGAALLGLAADLIVTTGPRATLAKRVPPAYAVLTLWFLVPLLPIFINSDAYFADVAGQMGEDYAAGMEAIFQPWVIGVWGLVLLVLGFIGGVIGVRTTRRHFARAGLA